MSEPATYVYCLVQSARPPLVKAAPEGMPGGGRPRALFIDQGLWAIVADAPLERFSGEQFHRDLQDLETVSRHALAHATMIEFFFRRSPVIPLKLFTLFSGDERAQAHLAGRAPALRALFARLRGLEEWGVRVTASLRPLETKPRPSPVTGRDYLEVKKRVKDDQGAPSPAAKRAMAGALGALGGMATARRKDDFPPPGPGRPYVIGASFLVRMNRRAVWKRRVSQLAALLDRQGHRLEVSGPWPPYHFASASRGTRRSTRSKARA